MSRCLRETENVRSRKLRHCLLCEEQIDAGDPHFVRVGIGHGDLWEMRIHRECRAFEHQRPPSKDWYECPDGPAFSRAAVLDAARKEAQP